MKQNKYGVYLRGGADVNEWMVNSSKLAAIGNAALSCYNLSSGVPSLVYVPKGEALGGAQFPEPLFMNIANGDYEFTSKTGFIHAVYGSDALENDTYAADYIGCRSFRTTLSEAEVNKGSSKEDGLTDGNYAAFTSSAFLGRASDIPTDRADSAAVLDGLFSHRKTAVFGDSARVSAAIYGALTSLPSADGANMVSFNTAATRADAVKASRLCGVFRVNPNDIDRNGVEFVNLDMPKKPSSSFARLISQGFAGTDVCDGNIIADGLDGYLDKWEDEARIVELNELAKRDADLSLDELDICFELYAKLNARLKREECEVVRINAEKCFSRAAGKLLFSQEFFSLGAERVGRLLEYLKDVPPPEQVDSVLKGESADDVAGFIGMIIGLIDDKKRKNNNAAAWLCAVCEISDPAVVGGLSKALDRITDKDRLLTLALFVNNGSPVFTDSAHPYPSRRVIEDRVFKLYPTEADKRVAYARTEGSNAVWLLQKAYVTIADDASLEEWTDAGVNADGEALDALTAAFKKAFRTYLTAHPANEKNCELYIQATVLFVYEDEKLSAALARLKNSAENKEQWQERLEENLRRRAEFVKKERQYFMPGVSKNVKDSEIEKIIYAPLYRKRRRFGGAYILFWIAAALAGGAITGLAVLVRQLFGLPWSDFFATLSVPIEGVPIKAVMIVIPIVLSVAVAVLTYAFGNGDDLKRFCKSMAVSALTVTLPYTLFVLTTGIIYLLV